MNSSALDHGRSEAVVVWLAVVLACGGLAAFAWWVFHV